MAILDERIWGGSETSYQAAQAADEGITARVTAGNDDVEVEGPRLLSMDDGLATITIKGSLVNSDSPYLRYFGVTGYGEIREALMAAATDPEVKQILLDIDSGGGAVSGVDDTAKLVRLINDSVKPVCTYTDGNMASAAYWIGSAAGEVYSSKSALVGSIGIISTFREYSEANKQAGIGVTVIRAGKHKALANSNEKLTPAAKAQIQAIVDSAYGVFVDHVANMRGKSYDYADKTMADGQEFIGQAALDVGLVDGITSFDALVSDLKEKNIAIEQKSRDNYQKYNKKLYGGTQTALHGDKEMAKQALTEQDIAALAAGGSLVETPVVPATGTVIEQPTESADNEAAKAAAGDPSGDPVDGEHAQDVAKTDAAVQLLSSQLQAKDEALLQANIQIAKLTEKLGEVEASSAPMLKIVAQSVSNMTIALGGHAFDAEGMSSQQVLAEHSRMSAQFTSKFKANGVAATPHDSEPEKTPVSPRHIARVNGVRHNQ